MLIRPSTLLVLALSLTVAAEDIPKPPPIDNLPFADTRKRISGFFGKGKDDSKPESPPNDEGVVKKMFGSYVMDRKTNTKHYEEMAVPVRVGMKSFFGTHLATTAVARQVINKLTIRQGVKYNAAASTKDIPGFIKQFNLDLNELLEPNLASYKNYNEFFYRKLKPEARPIADTEVPTVLVSAADCRLHVFPTVKQATEVWIKGKNFNLANLFKNPALAQEFEGGSLAIFRLAPQDYHRFHSPVDGTVESVTPIDGTYYTVNPMAVQDTIDVFTENKRVVVVIKSPTYGKVAFVCIGAMMVGSIQFTGGKVGTVLKKGDEIGYFAFGGSTVVTVFQKNKVTFDADLVRNSAGVIETIVKMGNKIGNANG